MSNEARNRKSSKLQAPNKRIAAESWSDHSPNDGGYLAAFMWAPFHRETPRMGIVILGFLMELIGTLVFCLFTNFARQNLVLPPVPATATDMVTLSAVVVGLVSAGTFYAATGWRLQDDEQPRHLSWTISIGYFLVFRTGLIPLIVYLCAQTGGAALAGLVIWGIGPGIVPAATTIPFGMAFGFEVLGSFLIIFALLYNNLYGGSYESEREHTRQGQVAASLMRFLSTSTLGRANAYSFDAVIYLAGLIGFGLSSNVDNPYVASPAFFLLVPMVGMAGAVIVYYVLLLLFRLSTPTKRRTGISTTESSIDARQGTSLEELVTRHARQ